MTRVVLFAHGSRDPNWCATFERLREEIAERICVDRVELPYMQFKTPTLADVAARAVADGVDRLVLLPLFLSSGGHLSRDVPEIVGRVRDRHPGLQIDVERPVGEDDRFVRLVVEIVDEIAGAPRQET